MMCRVLLACSLLTVTGARAAVPLRMAGSDLLGDAFQQALTAHAGAEQVDMAIELKGSLPAREALLAGRVEIAVIARADEGTATDGGTNALAGFRRMPVAWLAAVIVVPAGNPLTQITYGQLAGVFGIEAVQSARRWGDLGLGDAWAARAIEPIALSPRTSLVLDFFTHTILPHRKVYPTLAEIDDIAGAVARLGAEPGAIALLPVVPVGRDGVRALLVARQAGDVAFGPSPENIEAGDYPLHLPLELVFRSGIEATVAPVVRFFASDAGAAAVEKSLLVPLPARTRSRLAAEFAPR